MFEHIERTARLQHAQDFAEAAQGIINGAEDQCDNGAVKDGINERYVFGDGLCEMNRDARVLDVI